MEKGFTLFTALVSFILIVLTSLLISNFISTSATTSNIIASIEEQSQLQAIADLARADAIQAFNYNVRFKMERYLLGEKDIELNMGKDWQDLQDEFAKAFFANPSQNRYNFAFLLSRNIGFILGNPPSVKGYSIELINTENEAQLTSILQNVVGSSVTQGDFFEVVDCDGSLSNCDKGTFYINLNFEDLTDEEYEKLPQIRVESLATGRVIREPILPRTNFKIYVPIRIFKAMAISKSLAESKLQTTSFHDTMEKAGLGMCERNRCYPRTSIYEGKSTDTSNGRLCPGDSGSTFGALRGDLANNEVLLVYGSNYNPSDLANTQNTLQRIMKGLVCKESEGFFTQISAQGADFALKGLECSGISNASVSKLEIGTEARESADVEAIPQAGSGGNYSLFCVEPVKLVVGVDFVEQNENYIVNKLQYQALGNDASFRIALRDSYSPFQGNTWDCYSVCEVPGGLTGGVTSAAPDPSSGCVNPRCSTSRP